MGGYHIVYLQLTFVCGVSDAQCGVCWQAKFPKWNPMVSFPRYRVNFEGCLVVTY